MHPDMERPVNTGTSVFLSVSFAESVLLCSFHGAERKTVEELMSTVDHSDIRGSGLGPAVIIVIRRELPRTCGANLASGLSHRVLEGPPFRVPLDRRPPCFHSEDPFDFSAYAADRFLGAFVCLSCSTATPIAQ